MRLSSRPLSFSKMMEYVICFVMCFHVPFCWSHDISHFSMDEITSMFEQNGCIEGSLVTLQPTSSIPPTIFMPQQMYTDVTPENGGESMTQQGTQSAEYHGSAASDTSERTKTTTDSSKTILSEILNEKNPMCVVNELSNLMKVRHEFLLANVQGLPHQRRFDVTLKFGDEEYSAEGASVKNAQHLAASKYLHHTNYQLPLQEIFHKMKIQKRSANAKSPTSLLYEIAAKHKLPLHFEVESEEGPPHIRTFVTKCTLGDKILRGKGSSKKLSKRAAAEKMLQQVQNFTPSFFSSIGMGNAPSYTPSSGMGKLRRKRNARRKKKRTRSLLNIFQKFTTGMQSGQTSKENLASMLPVTSGNNITNGMFERVKHFAKGLLNGGSLFGDDTWESKLSSKDMQSGSYKSQASQSEGLTPKDRLMRVALTLNFNVQFADLPKGHNEFLTLVSLSMDEPKLCLGAGSTIDASHDQAALMALKALSKMDENFISSSGNIPNGKTGWKDWHHLTQWPVKKVNDVLLLK